MALKSNRVPSDILSINSKGDKTIAATTPSSVYYRGSLRGSVQDKKSEVTPKVHYNSSRKYYKMMNERQQFVLPSRGRNEPVVSQYPNKTLSSRYSQRKSKVPTTANTLEPSVKLSTSYITKDHKGIEVYKSYSYTNCRKKLKS